MIILDTHVLIWTTQSPQILGKKTTELIELHWQNEQVAVSTISFWECQMLQNKKNRIHLPYSVDLWRDKLVNKGLIEIPLDAKTAILSANLELHGDPADRMIVATALQQSCLLISADEKILAYKGNLLRQNAKK